MIKVLLVFVLLFSTSCSLLNKNSTGESAMVGGVGGAAIGAGIGAIVGNVIKNGDVTNSVLLGAGIGLAAGAGIVYAYTVHKQNEEIDSNNETIKQNYVTISQNQEFLNAYRQKVVYDVPELAPTAESPRHYIGATIGQD